MSLSEAIGDVVEHACAGPDGAHYAAMTTGEVVDDVRRELTVVDLHESVDAMTGEQWAAYLAVLEASRAEIAAALSDAD